MNESPFSDAMIQWIDGRTLFHSSTGFAPTKCRITAWFHGELSKDPYFHKYLKSQVGPGGVETGWIGVLFGIHLQVISKGVAEHFQFACGKPDYYSEPITV